MKRLTREELAMLYAFVICKQDRNENFDWMGFNKKIQLQVKSSGFLWIKKRAYNILEKVKADSKIFASN